MNSGKRGDTIGKKLVGNLAINSEKLKFLFLKFLYAHSAIAKQIDEEYLDYVKSKKISKKKTAILIEKPGEEISSNKMKSTCVNKKHVRKKEKTTSSFKKMNFSKLMTKSSKEQARMMGKFTKKEPVLVSGVV